MPSPAPSLPPLYAFGVEAHLKLPKAISTPEEAVHLPQHHLLVARFLGIDDASCEMSYWSSLTGHQHTGNNFDRTVQRSLRDYPVDGHQIPVMDTGVNWRAVARTSTEERVKSNRVAESPLQGPPRDMEDIDLLGTICGWGVCVERGNRGDPFYVPYLAVQAWREDGSGVIPATIHARLLPPLCRESRVDLAAGETLFHGPDGQRGCVPDIFDRIRNKYLFGASVIVRPRWPRRLSAYYEFSRVETAPTQAQLSDLKEKFNVGASP